MIQVAGAVGALTPLSVKKVSNTCCVDFFLSKAIMTIISGPDHITFPFPAPWTTVTSHIETQDPPYLSEIIVLIQHPVTVHSSVIGGVEQW